MTCQCPTCTKLHKAAFQTAVEKIARIPQSTRVALKIADWGFSFQRFYNGGAPDVPIAWQWQLTIYWRWRGWWYDHCFYFGKPHEVDNA